MFSGMPIILIYLCCALSELIVHYIFICRTYFAPMRSDGPKQCFLLCICGYIEFFSNIDGCCMGLSVLYVGRQHDTLINLSRGMPNQPKDDQNPEKLENRARKKMQRHIIHHLRKTIHERKKPATELFPSNYKSSTLPQVPECHFHQQVVQTRKESIIDLTYYTSVWFLWFVEVLMPESLAMLWYMAEALSKKFLYLTMLLGRQRGLFYCSCFSL